LISRRGDLVSRFAAQGDPADEEEHAGIRSTRDDH
jgi:hypothetical protein